MYTRRRMKLAILALGILVGQLVLPVSSFSLTHSTVHVSPEMPMNAQQMNAQQDMQTAPCDNGVACQSTANDCLGYCLATSVVSEQAPAILLLLVVFLIVIVARFVVAYIQRAIEFIPRTWYPPRYLFTTVRLLE